MVLSGLSTKGMNRAYKWILKLLLQSQTFRYVNTISSQFGLKSNIIIEIDYGQGLRETALLEPDVEKKSTFYGKDFLRTLALYPKPRG